MIGCVILAWAGVNAVVLVGSLVLAWLRRHDEGPRDVHEILDGYHRDND